MANINPITVIISITTVKESDKNENVLIKYKAKQVNPKTTAMLRMDLYKNGARYVGGYYAVSVGDGFSSSALLDAAANDTVYLVLQSASTTLFYGGGEPHTYLTGYLLG